MTIKDKQSSLPTMVEQDLQDDYKPVYMAKVGSYVAKRGSAVSISGNYVTQQFLDEASAKDMLTPDRLPWVLSTIYNAPNELAGYLIFDASGVLQLVPISKLAEFLQDLPEPIADCALDADYILGKCLNLGYTPHKIYLHYPNKRDSQDKGFRNPDDSIKLITPDMQSRHWFCSLTYSDFKSLYDYYNKTLFDNKLCQTVIFRWLIDSKQPIYTEITLEQEADVLKAEFIEGYKPMRATIYINREFFKHYPHIFLELFIHQLIHCLGISANHNNTFQRYCDIIRGKMPDLDLLDIDAKDISDAKGKWYSVDVASLKADNHNTVTMLCPVCDNILKQGRNNTYICLQGHSFKCK